MTGLAAVQAQFLAVGQYDAFEPDDLLTVGELICDARDRGARFPRWFGPAVGLHSVDRGATDQPFLRPSLIALNLESHHRVRIGPRELGHRALHGHEPVIAHRP